jgi:ectoine hydroxylase-related dioxygenase (phytanoyl-CoA dioxygenase family)
MRDGYLILPGAVDAHLATRIAAGMTAAFAQGDDRLRYDTDGAVHHVLTAGTDPRGKRIIEAHAVLPDVRDAFAAPGIIAFLSAIFEEPPILSQTLMFQMGSEQGYHRDTTFVRFDAPLRMVGCWIALEDVQPGSGELRYLVGSHRLPDFPFSHGKKDGIGIPAEELQASLQWVIDESEKAGLRAQTFNAKKGDALIWHADLAHGGSPITNPALTRQSVVGHLSPLSVGRSMHAGTGVKRKHGPLHYCSTYYDLKKVT